MHAKMHLTDSSTIIQIITTHTHKHFCVQEAKPFFCLLGFVGIKMEKWLGLGRSDRDTSKFDVVCLK